MLFFYFWFFLRWAFFAAISHPLSYFMVSRCLKSCFFHDVTRYEVAIKSIKMQEKDREVGPLLGTFIESLSL